MLFIIRFILIILSVVLLSIYSLLYCAFSPRNPKNTHHFAIIFSKMARIVGLKVTYRIPDSVKDNGSVVYIANHQNNYDMVTTTGSVQPGTVTIGKKSLVWVPFFGIIYWLTGNIMINREDQSSAKETIKDVVDQMKAKDLSVMIFPEGTRSRGRGLMPFKMGAFHTALQAGVNVVPTVISNTHEQVNLNRWDNGEVIVEILDPIDISQYKKREIRRLMNDAHEIMLAKYIQLNEEVKRPDNNTNCCG
ncbi:1-acyl-sn-glycerol-3-phosphate acyltransferase [Psychromonas sp. psych-6C06]|uniref:1-acylglycerol-3-phosphate O-acyltransferase n=1 Tax=Psychromonas sp. psych-6C06 TaxID=2058089 RepID=UPI000C342F2A|nr:1-acylglycerol-3-phosphate O-acyltransferase [Psychromonas sp. psych-6C06]PKF62817.1 1-acyl-sn-glycerol-3-phosphate acyltransferase [Psychromonas sp. psych-6C06]